MKQAPAFRRGPVLYATLVSVSFRQISVSRRTLGPVSYTHLNRTLITGKICGIRVEEIEDPLMRDIRYLDKLVDELAKGKAMEKILRKQIPDDE